MRKYILIWITVFSVATSLFGCHAAGPNFSTDGTAETVTTVPSTAETTPLYVEVWREGEVSQIPVQTVTGKAGSYTMAMDPEFFTFYPLAETDLYSYDGWDPAQPVYYQIRPHAETYDVGKFVTESVPSGYQLSHVQSITLAGFPACEVVLSGTGENQAYVIHKYLINCEDACYEIEARFSLEMYEGLFAIMYACFETFSPQ